MNKLVIEKDGTIMLSSFSPWLDISKVEFYKLELKEGLIKIKFYDKKRKLVRPYGKS